VLAQLPVAAVWLGARCVFLASAAPCVALAGRSSQADDVAGRAG
jgi:hypothetical protein